LVLNETHQLLLCAVDVILSGENKYHKHRDVYMELNAGKFNIYLPC